MDVFMGASTVVVSFVLFLTDRTGLHESTRYSPPPQNDPSAGGNKLESTNYENTVLFSISCFQYILVAAVFSIGPPYRKSMWTNGAWKAGNKYQ